MLVNQTLQWSKVPHSELPPEGCAACRAQGCSSLRQPAGNPPGPASASCSFVMLSARCCAGSFFFGRARPSGFCTTRRNKHCASAGGCSLPGNLHAKQLQQGHHCLSGCHQPWHSTPCASARPCVLCMPRLTTIPHLQRAPLEAGRSDPPETGQQVPVRGSCCQVEAR